MRPQIVLLIVLGLIGQPMIPVLQHVEVEHRRGQGIRLRPNITAMIVKVLVKRADPVTKTIAHVKTFLGLHGLLVQKHVVKVADQNDLDLVQVIVQKKQQTVSLEDAPDN